MKSEEELRNEIKNYIYNAQGHVSNARMQRKHLESHGFTEHLNFIDREIASKFPTMKYTEHVRIFCKDMNYQPVCKFVEKSTLNGSPMAGRDIALNVVQWMIPNTVRT